MNKSFHCKEYSQLKKEKEKKKTTAERSLSLVSENFPNSSPCHKGEKLSTVEDISSKKNSGILI